MTRLSLLLTAGTLALTAGIGHAQDDKTLAIVVKGLDNPFFEQINLGCQKWMSEHAGLRIQVPLHRPGLIGRRGRRGADRR